MLLYKVEITDNAKDVYASINLQRESLVMISARDRVPTSFLQFMKQVNRRYNNPLQQLYERSISPASVARKKRGLMKCELAQTLASFNGFKYIVLQGTNPFKDSKTNGCNHFSCDDYDGYIRCFVLLLPYAISVLRWADIIEVDASFKASYPYVYYIITCVKNNNSIPIGFSIAPTESEELYSTTFQVIDRLTGDSGSLVNQKYFLSDFGEGIKSFISKRGLDTNHYYCARHYINLFGANSYLQPIASDLLFSSGEEEFQTIVNSSKYGIALYANSVGYESVKPHLTRLSKLTGWLYNGTGWEQVPPVLKTHLVRFHRGFSTCSNHLESIHRQINRKITGKGFISRLKVIYDYMLSKYDQVVKNPNINSYRTIKRLISRKEAMESSGIHYNSVEHCNCNEKIYLSCLFGREFPCIHTVSHHTQVPEIDPLPEFHTSVPNDMVIVRSDQKDIVVERATSGKRSLIPKQISFNDSTLKTKYSALLRIISECTRLHKLNMMQSSIYINDLRTLVAKELDLDPYDPRVLSSVRVKMHLDKHIYNDYKDIAFNSEQSSEESPSLSELETEYSDTEEEISKPSGLLNLGATCYFNSVVQLLASMPLPTRETRLAEDFRGLCNRINSGTATVLNPIDVFISFSNEFIGPLSSRKYSVHYSGNALTCFRDVISLVYDGNDMFNIGYATQVGDLSIDYKRNVIRVYATDEVRIKVLIAQFIKENNRYDGSPVLPPDLLFEVDREETIYCNNEPLDVYYNKKTLILDRELSFEGNQSYSLKCFIEMFPLDGSELYHYIAKRIIGKTVYSLDDACITEAPLEKGYILSSHVVAVHYMRNEVV